MTLIHDEMAVASDLIRHLCLADETLYQSNVDSSRGLTATAADGTNVINSDRQKLPQSLDPLLQ